MRWFWIVLGTLVLSGALAGIAVPVVHLGLNAGVWTLRVILLAILAGSFVVVWKGANGLVTPTKQ